MQMDEEQLRDIAWKNVIKLTSNSTLFNTCEEVEYPQFLPHGKHSFIFIYYLSRLESIPLIILISFKNAFLV